MTWVNLQSRNSRLNRYVFGAEYRDLWLTWIHRFGIFRGWLKDLE